MPAKRGRRDGIHKVFSMFRTVATYSKRIVMPRLSPTLTSARIVRWEVQNGDAVTEYDPVLIVECAPDFVTEAFRDYQEQTVIMMIDTQDEGIIQNLVQSDGTTFLPVGTELGMIDDGDPTDADWTWQAYLHTEEEDDGK